MGSTIPRLGPRQYDGAEQQCASIPHSLLLCCCNVPSSLKLLLCDFPVSMDL